MFDDIYRLRDNPRLVELLSHYADRGQDDRAVWQDRLMHMDGLEPRDVSKLHGELIAFDWIEQNASSPSAGPDGVVRACYRITLNGVRDLARYRGETVVERLEAPEPKPSFARKRKAKNKSGADAGIAPSQIGEAGCEAAVT